MVLNISPDGSLLTYNQTRLFHFDQERTGEGLSERDTICTVNIPLVVSTAHMQLTILCRVNAFLLSPNSTV